MHETGEEFWTHVTPSGTSTERKKVSPSPFILFGTLTSNGVSSPWLLRSSLTSLRLEQFLARSQLSALALALAPALGEHPALLAAGMSE